MQVLHFETFCNFFSPNIFDPKFVESADREPKGMEGWLLLL